MHSSIPCEAKLLNLLDGKHFFVVKKTFKPNGKKKKKWLVDQNCEKKYFQHLDDDTR